MDEESHVLGRGQLDNVPTDKVLIGLKDELDGEGVAVGHVLHHLGVGH